MKKLFAGLLIAGTAVFASAQTISFDKTTFDYGTVKTGADGHRNFTVTNTGDKPLIISSVKAGCGCTTPEWSQDPIMPGKSALIKVGYNTGINGMFTKNIEVFSNDPVNSRSVLYIKGNVDPNAADAPVKAEVAEVKEVKADANASKKAVKKTAAKSKKAAVVKK